MEIYGKLTFLVKQRKRNLLRNLGEGWDKEAGRQDNAAIRGRKRKHRRESTRLKVDHWDVVIADTADLSNGHFMHK